jgi:hypothetical protein
VGLSFCQNPAVLLPDPLPSASSELTPQQRRSLWRGEALVSPRAQRAAWRERWPSPYLVQPAANAQVLQAGPFWGPPLAAVPLRALPGYAQRLLDEARFGRAPLDDLSGPLGTGTWRRVRGVVLEGSTFASATGHPCVVAAYLGHRFTRGEQNQAAVAVREEIHATSFRIMLPSRAVVAVRVEHARFLPRPRSAEHSLFARGSLAAYRLATRAGEPAEAHVRHQELVLPGDPVEVLGCFHRALARGGSPGSRTPALETVASGDGPRPLLLRAPR